VAPASPVDAMNSGPSWPTGSMRGIVLTRRESVEVRRIPIPERLPGFVLVKVAYLGLCGTDASFYLGTSHYLSEGLKRYPFTIGHEWSGTIVATGPEVTRFEVGDRVVGHGFIYCDACDMCRSGRRNICRNRSEVGVQGPFPGAGSEFIAVPQKTLTPIPAEVSLRHAALVEPTVTAVRAHALTRTSPADRVAVLGTGTLGLQAVQIAVARGASVTAVGISAESLRLADRLGAEQSIAPEAAPSDSYSVVIEASGAAAACREAVRLVAPGGRVAVVGVPDHHVDDLPIGDVVLKDVAVYGVLHGIDHYDATVAMIARGLIDMEPLIADVVALRDSARAFELLLSERVAPKILISMSTEQREDLSDVRSSRHGEAVGR
jgi:2-desacetyl-2-hydroxyethyl bacteriochlorophyllide A dehydrogenase